MYEIQVNTGEGWETRSSSLSLEALIETYQLEYATHRATLPARLIHVLLSQEE